MQQRSKKTKVLMCGVSEKSQRGMWTVVRNYLYAGKYQEEIDLTYVPTAAVFDSHPIVKLAFFARAANRISRILSKEMPEIVHFHVSEGGSVYRKKHLAEKAKRTGAKIVLHMHGGSFFDSYHNGSERYRATIQRLMSLSDAILVLGNQYKEKLEQIGIPEEMIHVVPNGVGIPAVNPYSRMNNNIIYLGGITVEKGIVDLLEAVNAFGDDWPIDGVVRLYGPLSDLDIEREINSRGLTKRVVYCGVVTGSAKDEALSQAAYAILPSHFEVLPMVVLETMARGIPTLSTDVGMVADVVLDDQTGLLCNPEDTASLQQGIHRLFSLAEPQVSALSENAYNKVKNDFSSEAHIEKVLSIYRALLDDGDC